MYEHSLVKQHNILIYLSAGYATVIMWNNEIKSIEFLSYINIKNFVSPNDHGENNILWSRYLPHHQHNRVNK